MDVWAESVVSITPECRGSYLDISYEGICVVHTKHTHIRSHRYTYTDVFFFTFTSRWDVLIACEGNDPSYMQRSDWVIRCEKPLKLPPFFFCPHRPLLPPFVSNPPTSSTLSSIPSFPTLKDSLPPSSVLSKQISVSLQSLDLWVYVFVCCHAHAVCFGLLVQWREMLENTEGRDARRAVCSLTSILMSKPQTQPQLTHTLTPKQINIYSFIFNHLKAIALHTAWTK